MAVRKTPKRRKPTGRKTIGRKPTNNGLVQGVANSAWPMWAPNNRSKMTQNAQPLTASAGTNYMR